MLRAYTLQLMVYFAAISFLKISAKMDFQVLGAKPEINCLYLIYQKH